MLAPCREMTPVSRCSVPGWSATVSSRATFWVTLPDEDLDRGGHAGEDDRVPVVESHADRHLGDGLGGARADGRARRGCLAVREVRHDAEDLAREEAVERVDLHLDGH